MTTLVAAAENFEKPFFLWASTMIARCYALVEYATPPKKTNANETEVRELLFTVESLDLPIEIMKAKNGITSNVAVWSDLWKHFEICSQHTGWEDKKRLILVHKITLNFHSQNFNW